jgi:hypothetical protein
MARKNKTKISCKLCAAGGKKKKDDAHDAGEKEKMSCKLAAGKKGGKKMMQAVLIN